MLNLQTSFLGSKVSNRWGLIRSYKPKGKTLYRFGIRLGNRTFRLLGKDHKRYSKYGF